MSEPASSAAGGFAAWKLGVSILGTGVVASALGFLVLLPKTPREAAARVLATMAGSALFGPVLVIVVFSKWPDVFQSGEQLMSLYGIASGFGHLVVAAPIMASAGLPFWWILGAGVRWFDKRNGKDLGELAADAKADIRNAVTS